MNIDRPPGPGLTGIDAFPWPMRALPSITLAAIGVGSLLLHPLQVGPMLALVGAYLVTPLGPEAWLAVAYTAFGIPLPHAAAVLLWVSALQVLTFGLTIQTEALVVRLPRLGARVRRLEERVRARPRNQRNVALGLFLTVLLPIHSGGAIVASIAGRILGLSAPLTIAAVLGAITIRFLVAVALVAGLLSFL